MSAPDDRRADLAARLAAVRARIDAACAAAGRAPDEVTLLAVTKTVPASDVTVLMDLGLTAFGENRVQEAGAKVEEVAATHPGARWHLVGGLQRNKARAAVRWADRVESLDSVRLADALDGAVRRAQDAGDRSAALPVLLQFSVDGDPDRGGVALDGLLPLAEHVAGCAGLRLDGLMAVAPLGMDTERAFSGTAAAADRLRSAFPQARTLSAGMSGDLEVAIGHGSDVVRVGTALVGERRITSP
ncbi:YggS family pyridoxal phosphate-dependent enzyme [Pseudonocardia sp. KRD-184]|uniref:Pyridoxal phosphate homeostasis protein n=1 Tax=Pseudonocardia oceani TaxID=2792013 RepID=A0ABS6UFK5_9PSEU|nr:YggS family pyridoxal phosphate-dependent enzyme [Pseudonocardia oceani]MBW0093301.1 YggS family pyridoxal phosphate-dependent enzyme [Pseudonocardia oceani]MBW0099196.1 YggS family pyridoxal phosphate-dependent enzyme [Pseudonocardia oceani]MBW0111822.1 YggS family pyridoxal phosphate-dependent enzyme [Pseudonocardia oceani]MBW0125375.1 YggS family pyridoxal phosphate-dependent enzyme [Pseudonocardia oceani]MBW0131032.1 YggS family pyridoxal phosphate-dependent enzyme [Pseudonocardia ocean